MLASYHYGDTAGQAAHTEDLVGFTKSESKLILVHELTVLLGTFGPHCGDWLSERESGIKGVVSMEMEAGWEGKLFFSGFAGRSCAALAVVCALSTSPSITEPGFRKVATEMKMR